MKESSARPKRISDRIIWFGIGFGGLFWVLESILHVFIFHKGSLLSEIFTPDPHEIWMRSLIVGLFIIFGTYAQLLINHRKKAEQRIKHINLLLQSIRNVNQLITREKDRDALLQGICNNLVETRGYYNAWVALFDKSGTLLKTAEAGLGDDFLPMFEFLKRGDMTHCGRRALSQSDIVITEDPISTCVDCPLAGKYSGRWAMTVRLEHDGKVYGLLSVSIVGHLIGYKEEQELFREVTNDIAYALYNMEQEDQRKHVEGALKRSEEKYRSLVETMTDVVFTLDTNGTFTFLNPEFEKATGYPSQDFIGRPFTEILSPEYRESTVDRFKRGLSGETIPIYEVEVIHKDGEKIPIELNVQTLLDAHGNLLGRIGVARDISERRQAEEALRKSEELKAAILSSMTELVAYHDIEHKVLWANRAAAESVDLAPEQLVGRYCYEIWQQRTKPCIGCPVERGIETGQPQEAEMTTPDGRTWFIRGNPVLDANGNVLGGIETTLEITKRKQAEEALKQSEAQKKAILDASIDRIRLSDTNMKTIWANETHARELNMQPEDITDQYCYKIFLNRDNPCPECPAQKTLVTGQVEHAILTRSEPIRGGEKRHLDAFAVPIKNDAGEIVNILHITRDITGKMKAEQERKKLESQLQQAQKMEAIGTLAGGIAHDFNNILFAIIGYTEMALHNELTEDSQARHSIEQVLKASYRARDLVKQILAFSRQGKQQRTTLGIGPIVKESLKLLRASLPSTIEIRQDITGSSGSIMADPGQIHQVLMNLCANAAYSMRNKGGEMGVSLYEVDLIPEDVVRYPDLDPGPYLKLAISDTGCGMDPEVMNKIFEPYFTTKPKGEGTGLGLSVVHGIVQTHGGMITVESEPGKGSTFNVFFPRAEGEATPMVVDPGPIPSGRERILIVDDEQTLVEIMDRSLKKLGYSVTATTSSNEALECFRARAEEFDLVITDQTMPGMTGDKLARELLKIRPDIPIILATGFSEVITAEKAMQMGIREFVMKPLVIREMARAIRRALND